MKKELNYIYLISFIEGGMMLTTELSSSRKIAIFFGSSLYVWLSVLCITMIGLAIGYYWANYYLESKPPESAFKKTLALLFILLSISLAMWKFNSNLSLFLIHLNTGLIMSVWIDSIFLLLPAMFIYGAITTFLIYIAQKIYTKPLYGKILATSTIGSIVFAVLSVLFLFPNLGIQNTILIMSFIALITSLIIYFKQWLLHSVVVMLYLYPEKKIKGDVLYENDGAFSSVIVMQEKHTRYLLVNYIIQSFEDKTNSKTPAYAQLIDSVLKVRQMKNKDVLILGLGGGIVANKLANYSNKIVGVEIDPGIIFCAKKYFNLSAKIQTICEDAQWYIQRAKHKFDIIIMDVFNGEEPPSYLLTFENFNRLKRLLKDENSLIIINWYGYYSGTPGKSTRILIHTLHQAGFKTASILTGGEERNSNLVIFASLNSSILPENKISIPYETLINTEDKNVLSFLNAHANYLWRRDYLSIIKYWWK